MIRVPHSRPCRMPSFRADISDQLTKFYFSSIPLLPYFSSIPLLPPLMEKTYPPADVSFSFTVFFWNGAEAAAPPSPPDRPVSARVRRKAEIFITRAVSQEKSPHKETPARCIPSCGQPEDAVFKSAHLPLLSKLLVLLCAQKTVKAPCAAVCSENGVLIFRPCLSRGLFPASFLKCRNEG